MKKQILALALCVALTTSAALAQGTMHKKYSSKTAVQSVPGTANVLKSQLAPQAPGLGNQQQPKGITQEDARKRFEERQNQERQRLYSDLGLSEDQKTKAEALHKKTISDVEPLIKKSHAEFKKLRELKRQKASIFAIWKQEHKVKSSRDAVIKHFDKSKKDFETILTPEQKKKFEEIDARKKEEMKKMKKGPNGHNHKGFGPENFGPEHDHGRKHMGPPPEGMPPEGPVGPPPPRPETIKK